MEEGGECTLWRTHRFVKIICVYIIVVYYLLFVLLNVYILNCIRLDGQLDVVDSPKPIKLKEANTTKLDKNVKTESSINKNLGL